MGLAILGMIAAVGPAWLRGWLRCHWPTLKEPEQHPFSSFSEAPSAWAESQPRSHRIPIRFGRQGLGAAAGSAAICFGSVCAEIIDRN